MIRPLLLSTLMLGIALRATVAQAPPDSKTIKPPTLPTSAALGMNPLPEECAKWTALATLFVYDSWNHGRQVAQLAKDDRVTGLNTVIVTYTPSVIHMKRSFGGFRRGDIILMYAYYGNGIADTWYRSHFHPRDDISFATWRDGSGCVRCTAAIIDDGKSAVWAKIQLASGMDGWVDMTTAKFDGVCQRQD